MKKVIAIILFASIITSCGNNPVDNSKPQTNAAMSDTTGVAGQPDPDQQTSSGKDTTKTPGQGTDGIPSRTGATGQGNTTVTGTATGSPTGTGKDSSKPGSNK